MKKMTSAQAAKELKRLNELHTALLDKEQKSAVFTAAIQEDIHYPSCSSVDSMKESNKDYYSGSRDDLISMGYEPCKRCNP